MKAIFIVVSILAWAATAYVVGEADIVGSYPVYYAVVFLALMGAISTLSAFLSTVFYYRSLLFADVFLRVLPVVSIAVFILMLLANGTTEIW